MKFFIVLLLNVGSVFAGRIPTEREENRERNPIEYYQEPRSDEENCRLERLLNRAVKNGQLSSENVARVSVCTSTVVHYYDGFFSTHRLTIDRSVDDIEADYDKYGLIQLRSFTTNRLVIGCGLDNSLYRNRCPHDKLYLSSHEFDTWNIDPVFDPNIVGFWGDPENCTILKDKKYDTIIDEGPVIAFVENKHQYWQCVRLVLQNGGKILIPRSILSITEVPEDFRLHEMDDSYKLSVHDSAVFTYNKKQD